jgi:hypothetical protein
VEVLLLHRHLDRADVVAGISAALLVGSTNVDVVALEARKSAERHVGAESTIDADVVVLAVHRVAPLVAAEERPMPSMAQYDTLLNMETS